MSSSSFSKVKYPCHIMQDNGRISILEKLRKEDNPFWVKQALNVSRHSPADLMFRSRSLVLVRLLLTTIARTLKPAPASKTTARKETTLSLILLLVERLWWSPESIYGFEQTTLYVLANHDVEDDPVGGALGPLHALPDQLLSLTNRHDQLWDGKVFTSPSRYAWLKTWNW